MNDAPFLCSGKKVHNESVLATGSPGGVARQLCGLKVGEILIASANMY